MSETGQGYVIHKASRLLELGFEAYRSADAFHYPPQQLSPREAENLQKGAKQLSEGLGFDSSTPIRDVDLNDLFLLMACFHFELQPEALASDFRDGLWLDRAIFQHVSSHKTVTIHLAGAGEERHRKTRRDFVFHAIGPDYPPDIEILPMVPQHTVERSGAIGAFRYEVWTDCVSEGQIEYHHLLVCWAPLSTVPCLVIALEQLTEPDAPVMLCTFWHNRHLNHGTAPELLELTKFVSQSLDAAHSLLLEQS